MNSTSDLPAHRGIVDRLGGPFPLAAGAILLGWIAFGAAQLRSWVAWPIGIAGSILGLLAFARGRGLADARQAELKARADAATARTRQLEYLRALASTLLTFRSTDQLFAEVARVAEGLLNADGGAVMVGEVEARFLRVAGAHGLMQPGAGRLIPVEGSIGAAFEAGRSCRLDRVHDDSQSQPLAAVDRAIAAALIAPIRSGEKTVGVIVVCRRQESGAFADADVTLLEAVADQLRVGLDRAETLANLERNHAAIEESNRELLKATELKSQFLANMSHELRTPLNAIIGFADLMVDDPKLDDTDRDYLQSIARNGRHLLGLIEGVLDVAKAEAGRMTLRLETCDLAGLITTALADTESLRSPKRQRCDIELGPDLRVSADAGRLRQILFNLLSNAAKFTDDGGWVRVSAQRAAVPLPVRGGHPGPVQLVDAVLVSVHDNGIGIPPAETGRLFQVFSQVDGSSTRSRQGTGLGLALCRQLVELHGGTIGVDSAPGRGSTFWFALPVAGPTQPR